MFDSFFAAEFFLGGEGGGGWCLLIFLPTRHFLMRRKGGLGGDQTRCSMLTQSTAFIYCSRGGTFQATARFQDSDILQKAFKMVLGCILSVNSHLSGFQH